MLRRELPKNLKLWISGSEKILGKYQNWVERECLLLSPPSTIKNFAILVKTYAKADIKFY